MRFSYSQDDRLLLMNFIFFQLVGFYRLNKLLSRNLQRECILSGQRIYSPQTWKPNPSNDAIYKQWIFQKYRNLLGQLVDVLKVEWTAVTMYLPHHFSNEWQDLVAVLHWQTWFFLQILQLRYGTRFHGHSMTPVHEIQKCVKIRFSKPCCLRPRMHLHIEDCCNVTAKCGQQKKKHDKNKNTTKKEWQETGRRDETIYDEILTWPVWSSKTSIKIEYQLTGWAMPYSFRHGYLIIICIDFNVFISPFSR